MELLAVLKEYWPILVFVGSVVFGYVKMQGKVDMTLAQVVKVEESLKGIGSKVDLMKHQQGRDDERIKASAADRASIHDNLHEIRTLIGREKGAREEAHEIRRDAGKG